METKTKFRKLESFTKKEQEIIEKKNWELTDDYFKALADAGGLSPLSCGLHRLMYMIWVNTGMKDKFTINGMDLSMRLRYESLEELNEAFEDLINSGLIKVFVDERDKSVAYQFIKYIPENNKLKK